MSQPTSSIDLPDLVDSVVREITDALTRHRSMAEPRRRSLARMVPAMVLGLFPGDVMQLMLAGQAVLFHALTIDAAGDLERESEATRNARARSIVANLSRTMTRNLDTLVRSQASSAKDALTRATGPIASARRAQDLGEALPLSPRDVDADDPCDPPVEPAVHDDAEHSSVSSIGHNSEGTAEADQAVSVERVPAEAMSRQLFTGDTVPETPVAVTHAAPLNRQQRRRWERGQAKLARRSVTLGTVKADARTDPGAVFERGNSQV
jgi:hypothetical protein